MWWQTTTNFIIELQGVPKVFDTFGEAITQLRDNQTGIPRCHSKPQLHKFLHAKNEVIIFITA